MTVPFGLVAAVLLICNQQQQCESHSLHIQKKACGFHVEAYRPDKGRGTISVKCPK